jgi:hypothetical protein
MATAHDESRTNHDQSLCRFIGQWTPIQLAALVGLGLIPFIAMPHLSHQMAADAASTTLNSPKQNWFPTEYRPWKQSSAWKPQIITSLWNRPSCKSDQTCLPVKVITRDDCNLLTVSASMMNPSTGQILLATANTPKVGAGQEQNLTLRWNLPPDQANETLARETKRKIQIDHLADRQGNSSLRELAMAHISTKLNPAPPAWQSVTIKDIRCL